VKMIRGELMTAKKRAESRIDSELASKILRTVPQNQAFYFFTGVGQYSGELATSLTDFCRKIETIDVRAVDFHFKRRDFQKWIRGTIGDLDLANEIDKIQKSIQGEKLRDKIHQTIERRLTELKELLASKEGFLMVTFPSLW